MTPPRPPTLEELLADAPPGPLRDILEAIMAPLDGLDEDKHPAWLGGEV